MSHVFKLKKCKDHEGCTTYVCMANGVEEWTTHFEDELVVEQDDGTMKVLKPLDRVNSSYSVTDERMIGETNDA